MVRVTSKDSNSRGLVKGLVGPPQDLAFAHIEEEMVLASVDEEGNLFVHTVELPEVMYVDYINMYIYYIVHENKFIIDNVKQVQS